MKHTVEEVKLKCGAKGLLIDVPGSSVVAMEAWFRAGYSKVKEYEKREVAHIMEHMALGANSEQHSSAEADRFIQKNGAYSNAWTSREYIAYTRVCPDFDWKRILRQLVVQLTTPKFLKKEFTSEFGNVEQEMQQSSNNRWRELDFAMDSGFGEPFSEFYLERLSLMQSVKVEDVKEHYKRTHGADNAVVFIVGDLKGKKSEILKTLEGLSSLPSTKRFKLMKPSEAKLFKKPLVLKKEDVPNVYVSFRMHAKKKDSNQAVETLRLNTLGEILTSGDHSRIYGKARQRGLVYSLGYSRGMDIEGQYYFEIYFQAGQDKIDSLFDLISTELVKLKNCSLSEEEVQERVNAGIGSLRISNQTVQSILDWNAGWYTSSEVEKVHDFSKVGEWYKKVDVESIQELFLNLIKSKKWGAGFLGNVTEEDAKKWNAKLAEIFEDDPKN